MRKSPSFGPLIMVMLALSCSSAEPSSGADPAGATSPDQMSGGGQMAGHETTLFGEPAEPADADRVVEVAQLDELRFDPATIDGKLGEMAGLDGALMDNEANGVGLQSGESASLTWTFTELGTVIYACHVAGHYAGGMVGAIRITQG